MCYSHKVLLLKTNKLMVHKLHRSLKYYLRKLMLTQNLPNKPDCLKLSLNVKGGLGPSKYVLQESRVPFST